MKQSRSKRFAIIFFSFVMLMMCWEYQLTHMALAEAAIPEESIRLRVLANSDGPMDQWIKRKVRDEIIQHMNEWVQDPQDIEQARIEVAAHVEEFRQVTEDVLATYGFTDEVKVEFGQVDFPTKLYGTKLYPAGDYEALKVTIGSGQGQNWWCVLFPPLCFVEIVAAESTDQLPIGGALTAPSDGEQPEVRFFLLDLLEAIIGWIKSLFA